MDESMYRQYIIDVYNNMVHKHDMDNADIVKNGVNPACGDKLVIYLKTDNGKINDSSFVGDGCLISQVSAELLLKKIEGMGINEIKKLKVEDMEEILGIVPSPSRIKCMDLCRKTLVDMVGSID